MYGDAPTAPSPQGAPDPRRHIEEAGNRVRAAIQNDPRARAAQDFATRFRDGVKARVGEARQRAHQHQHPEGGRDMERRPVQGQPQPGTVRPA